MAYSNPRPAGIIAINLDEGDELIGVRLTDGQQEVILSTARRPGDPLPRGGRARRWAAAPRGVRGITLEAGDSVVGVDVVSPGATLLAVAETRLRQAHRRSTSTGSQSRGGKGIITMNATDKTGRVVGVRRSPTTTTSC